MIYWKTIQVAILYRGTRGDFNVCLNLNLDKQGGAKVKQSERAKNEIAESNDLIDVWRTFNKDKRWFTWRSFTKKMDEYRQD